MSKRLTVMRFHGYMGATMLVCVIGGVAAFLFRWHPVALASYLVLFLLTVVNVLFTLGMLLSFPFRLLLAEKKSMPRGWWLGIVTALLSLPLVGFLGFFVGRT